MARARLRPLHEEHLPAVARFLAERSWEEPPPRLEAAAVDAEAEQTLRRLRWQTVESPWGRAGPPCLGHWLEDAEGRMAGTHLAFPRPFVLGERRLTGLLSADLRGRPDVRRDASGLFLGYLRMKGVDFHYATTANRNAGSMWEASQAGAVAESDREWVLPLTLGPLAEEAVRRTRLRALAPLARLGGAALSPALAWLRRGPATSLALRPCADWEHLATLAERHRDRAALSGARTAAFLDWRFARKPGGISDETFLLVDSSGNEGWCALRLRQVGQAGARAAEILDLGWPRDLFDPRDALRAIAHHCAGDADLLRVKGRGALGAAPRDLGWRERFFDGPTSYVAGRDGEKPLAELADFVEADSDSP
jgi:hypothetical protein